MRFYLTTSLSALRDFVDLGQGASCSSCPPFCALLCHKIPRKMPGLVRCDEGQSSNTMWSFRDDCFAVIPSLPE